MTQHLLLQTKYKYTPSPAGDIIVYHDHSKRCSSK